MSTRSGSRGLANDLSAGARDIAGKVRRFAITLTADTLWQLLGHILPDDDNTPETRDAEVFPGIGIYARPPDGGSPEAIAVFLGGDVGIGNPFVIATRDEATRQAVANIDPGETVIYTDKAVVLIKADGSIEARSVGGAAVALATKADLQALAAVVASSTDYAAFKAAVAVLVTGPPAWPAGTSKFKAE